MVVVWYRLVRSVLEYGDGLCLVDDYFFFFKQKTAYEMRISDWSSDVCSSDLGSGFDYPAPDPHPDRRPYPTRKRGDHRAAMVVWEIGRASCRERVCQYV